MLPKISIVIPCYNHGLYLPEALANLHPDNNFYEVIIVNDGSTDSYTLQVLEEYEKKGFHVIQQPNMGLSEARNTGIANARGLYIQLLDADNLVYEDYLQQAAAVLDNDSNISVVYSDAEYFGSKTGRWVVGPFNLQKLMIANFIDACAMVRKSVFDELGGYDSEMKGGWEDWEMWLRISFSGKSFFYLPEIGFRYRVYPQSMSGVIRNNYENRNRLTAYLHKKYPHHIGNNEITAFVLRRFKPHPVQFLVKLAMLAWFRKKYQQLLSKNKIIEGI